jgi:uncharacterized protein (TIGR00251 family)
MAILKIKVQPCSSTNAIGGMWIDMVKVKVTAPPESGKANKACIELISEELNIPKNRIQILKGHTSKEKQIEIIGLSESELTCLLKNK